MAKFDRTILRIERCAMMPTELFGHTFVTIQTEPPFWSTRTSANDDPINVGPRYPESSPLMEVKGDSPKLRIIVADDEQIIADTLTLILNRSGFEAYAVYSGEAAIELLHTFEADVLISDVVMTGISGVEAALTFRSLRPNCKVLLFSGQAATADLLLAARARGQTFELLAKPVHPTELLARLRTASLH